MRRLPENGAYYTERLPDGRTAIFKGPRPAAKPGRFNRAAQARWDFENYVTLSTRVPRKTAERYRRFCERAGQTAYANLRSYVEYVTTPRGNGGV